MYVLRVDIFESKPYPVVRHEFRGMTQLEARHYFNSHLKTDRFLQGCVSGGHLGKINCRVTFTWIRAIESTDGNVTP
jgi:hypothetical protein